MTCTNSNIELTMCIQSPMQLVKGLVELYDGKWTVFTWPELSLSVARLGTVCKV